MGKETRLPLIDSREFALALIGIGLMALLLGAIEHGRDLRGMRAHYPGMPRSLSAVATLLVAALGVIALVVVIFRD